MTQRKNTAFLELYEPIHEGLFRYCRAITGNISDAEDLIQDTILIVLENYQKKRINSFRAYAYKVSSNLSKQKSRRKKFRGEFSSEELKSVLDFSNDPEIQTDFELILQRIHALPSKTSEALILFFISDLSLKDIQKIQGGSLSGVKSRIKRGREELLRQLNKEANRIIFEVLSIAI